MPEGGDQSATAYGNLLLRSAPFAALRKGEWLTRETVTSGDRLIRAGMPIRTVRFPDTALLYLGAGENSVVGVVGREGMLGWSALLGSRVAPLDVTVGLSGGTVWSIDVDVFTRICSSDAALVQCGLRFIQAMADQLAGAVASALHDPVERRLARWILMLHDRQDGDELALTHDDLSAALAVRRASVTDSLHVLEGAHILRCLRGRLLVRDRAGLEHAAGNSYGAAEASYRALIGPFGRTPPRPGFAMADREPILTIPG